MGVNRTPELLAICALVAVQSAAAQDVREPTIRLELLAEDLGSVPTFVTHAPGNATLVFVLTKAGVIRVFQEGTLLQTPFLDLTAITLNSGEGGLLGLAFHPGFQANGLLYVFHTVHDGPNAQNRVAEYRVDGEPGSAVTVDPDSRRVLLALPDGHFHNGGWMGFGPDGYLFISSGDGTGQVNGQQRSTLRGKMLRIDVDGRDPGLEYAIPPDNPLPLMGLTGRAEIWAYGLRNPWRCSFDRETGDLWIADVGETTAEEVNRQLASSAGGENYGWACFEGVTQNTSPVFGCNPLPSPLVYPVHYIQRNGWPAVVIGGYVYRGTLMPRLHGRYIFADAQKGNIYSLDAAAADPPVGGSIPSDVLLDGAEYFTSFGEDADGELYATTSTGMSSGRVYRIVAEPCSRADVTAGSQPGVRGYGQPNGVLDPDDFQYFVREFGLGNAAVADLTAGAIPGSPGYGVPDGMISNDDFFYYLSLYAMGCPDGARGT